MKITIAEVQEALARAKVPAKEAGLTIEHLQKVVEELEQEKEQQNPTPKVKNKFGVIILDELGDIKSDNLSALVYQIAEDQDYNTVPARVNAIVKSFNLTKKGQKHPVNSVTEAFQAIAPKIFKAEGIIRKTKEIIPVLKTNNKI